MSFSLLCCICRSNRKGVVRGHWVIGQYFKHDESPLVSVDGEPGWFPTGDVCTIDPEGNLFVNSGSATNVSQVEDRAVGSPGERPCRELETRAGIWRYSATRAGQRFGPEERHASGLRNAVGLAVNPADGALYSTQHGRDQLAENWPKLYSWKQSAELPAEEKQEFLESLGISEPGLHTLIRAGYRLLGLQVYFTAGEKEVRAWEIPVGAKAPEAAGVIHTDFERGFIRAETVAFADFEKLGSVKAAREQGLMRSEGKEYVVKDGDILLCRFNV
jgi:hypothetical protein